MSISAPIPKTLPPAALPAEFYASQVDALFSDARSFAIGAVAAGLSALTVAIRAQSWIILAVAVLLVALCCLRMWTMGRYVRARPRLASAEAVHRWELLYVLGASAQLLLLGLYCLITFVVTEDPFARLLSFATIMAYLAGTPGRNFANGILVDVQLLCGIVPIVVAMALAGSVYWFVSLTVLIPTLFALKGISARLRGIFVQAVTRAHELSILAGRFDTALNNMPQGLAMFDATGRVVVHNRQLVAFLLLDPERDYKGETPSVLLPHCVVESVGDRSPLAAFEAQLRHPSAEVFDVRTRTGVSLAFTFQAMESGGAVVLVQDVTERKRAEARIHHLALFDPLTSLPNRISFRQFVDRALREETGTGTPKAVVFIDLDQFKHVNDTLGHTRGDILLCEVADRLRDCLSPSDYIARFGGDEFVVFYQRALSCQALAEHAGALIARVSEPYEIDGNRVVIGASIGIAIVPDQGTDLDQYLREADMALYRAKADGRGTWRFFEPAMDRQERARRDLEVDLRHALAQQQFEVYYQPIFDVRLQRFTACEALLRWNHPTRGMISPAEFIPVAEEMGLIVEIGAWVMRQACLECAKWPADIRIAVNVSPMQFRNGNVVAMVRGALQEAGLSAQRLEIELTESVLLQDMALAKLTMVTLRDLRVRISLDDFGTGYSSLSYLHSLPLNKVKIDRSFLTGLDAGDRSLILLRGVAKLSAELGLDMVIEGVETEKQLSTLLAGCAVTEIQGYLFSRPVPARKIGEMLSESAVRAA